MRVGIVLLVLTVSTQGSIKLLANIAEHKLNLLEAILDAKVRLLSGLGNHILDQVENKAHILGNLGRTALDTVGDVVDAKEDLVYEIADVLGSSVPRLGSALYNTGARKFEAKTRLVGGVKDALVDTLYSKLGLYPSNEPIYPGITYPEPVYPEPTYPGPNPIDDCTQEVWETLPNGEVVVVRKNICGTETPVVQPTTTTRRPTISTTTRRPTPQTTTGRPTTTTSDPCTQEVWETLPNGEVVVVRKNVCGTETTTSYKPSTTTRPYIRPTTTQKTTTTRRPTTTTTTDPCTQEVYETLPNGEIVVVRKNICGTETTTPKTTSTTPYAQPSTTRRTTTQTTTSDPCTQEVYETLPSGEIVVVRKNICGTETTTPKTTSTTPYAQPSTTRRTTTQTTTSDPCTQEVYETLPSGEIVVVRKNICGTETTTPKTTSTTPYARPTTTRRTTTTTTTDPCTQEVWETLPSGEVVVIRKNICNTDETTTTTTTTTFPFLETSGVVNTDSCTQEIWEKLPNSQFLVVRRNICRADFDRRRRDVSDDYCTAEVYEKLDNGEFVVIRRNTCHSACFRDIEVNMFFEILNEISYFFSIF